jgi:RNA 2',3'-cyclic 3'-phosphodiesterase
MPTIRTFIAIELTTPILESLGDLQARMQRDLPPGLLRWVRPEGIHLTLAFLGDVAVERVDPIAEALAEACAGHAPFTVSVAGMGCFPNVRRPRVVWVGVEEPSGALARLQHDIEQALVPLGFGPEGRAFSPHLTLGRVKGGSREALAALGAYVERAKVRIGEMKVETVHLMRSDLRPSGAVYTALAVVPLE